MSSEHAPPPGSSFSRYLGIEQVEVQPERVVYRMAVTPDHANRNGVLHGGALLHAGRTTLVAQVTTTRSDGKELSATMQTQLFVSWDPTS